MAWSESEDVPAQHTRHQVAAICMFAGPEHQGCNEPVPQHTIKPAFCWGSALPHSGLRIRNTRFVPNRRLLWSAAMLDHISSVHEGCKSKVQPTGRRAADGKKRQLVGGAGFLADIACPLLKCWSGVGFLCIHVAAALAHGNFIVHLHASSI